MDKLMLFEFLKLASFLSLGLYLFSAVILIFFRNPIGKLHSSLLGLSQEELGKEYFRFLAHFKMLLMVFIWIPFVAIWLII